MSWPGFPNYDDGFRFYGVPRYYPPRPSRANHSSIHTRHGPTNDEDERTRPAKGDNCSKCRKVRTIENEPRPNPFYRSTLSSTPPKYSRKSTVLNAVDIDFPPSPDAILVKEVKTKASDATIFVSSSPERKGLCLADDESADYVRQEARSQHQSPLHRPQREQLPRCAKTGNQHLLSCIKPKSKILTDGSEPKAKFVRFCSQTSSPARQRLKGSILHSSPDEDPKSKQRRRLKANAAVKKPANSFKDKLKQKPKLSSSKWNQIIYEVLPGLEPKPYHSYNKASSSCHCRKRARLAKNTMVYNEDSHNESSYSKQQEIQPLSKKWPTLTAVMTKTIVSIVQFLMIITLVIVDVFTVATPPHG